jgi:ubiquinone/menaquinone biosynthesis C-methylase UbiE
VKATGKAPEPVHPHHLLRGSEHRWYAAAVRPGDRVLDIGCASGANAFSVAGTAAEVIGVDVDMREIERAREQALRGSVSNVRFETGDLTDPTTLHRFAPASFDVVLLLDVLEHLVNRVAVLKAVRGLLVPGGRLVVAVPNVETTYKRWRARRGGVIYANPDHKVEYTKETIRAELDRAGFGVERFEYGGFDTPLHGLGALLGALSMPLYRKLTERRHRIAQRNCAKASAIRIVAAPAQKRSAGAFTVCPP